MLEDHAKELLAFSFKVKANGLPGNVRAHGWGSQNMGGMNSSTRERAT